MKRTWHKQGPAGDRHQQFTDQANSLPGTERSAQQAAASREAAGRGKIKPRRAQLDPGGLFDPKEPDQSSLFE